MSETIQTKRCSKCKNFKSFTEFYKSRTNKDGFQNYCKICKKQNQKTKEGKASQRRYRQRYYKSNKGKTALKLERIHHPERYKAGNAVNNAIRAGKLPRPNTLQCHYCSEQAEQYHHHLGYALEHLLDVVPVCKKCHRKLHKKIA